MTHLANNTTRPPWTSYTNVTEDLGVNSANSLSNTIQTYCILSSGFLLNLIAAFTWTRPGCLPRQRTCPTIIRAALVWVDLLSITGYIIRGGLTPALKSFNYNLFCDIFGFTNTMFSLTSGMIAGVMSVDRFAALSTPFKYKSRFTPRRITLAILLAVVLSALVGSLPFLGIGSYRPIDHFHGTTVCKLNWFPNERPLFLLHFALYQVVGWFLVVVVVLSNVGVIRTLLNMRRHVAAAGTQPPNIDRKREVRFVRTMMLITLFFGFCWVPWMITTILTKVGSKTTLEGDVFVTRLLLANSAFDPLIFMVTSEVFCSRLRDKAGQALRRLCRGKGPDSPPQLNASFGSVDSDANTGPPAGVDETRVTTTLSLPSLSQTLGPIITVTEAPTMADDQPERDASTSLEKLVEGSAEEIDRGGAAFTC
ncbi:rhodopsin, GQ-coupled-like [Acanthaster planci]|uniref:Rhodopsin, GQ-coupled-like n=1 Tax=Acanthaster planci TaxID=133434 RepID=A0A8B7ZCU5_ACAPL|nr:rhodopsin, GQ-coupled-like [Acanthaster planci]XP_022103499.1 rhodopsin, GQ-coupled-like [Acanthaster planci]XP_022103501.1 rhodopsin, GQ-coupled-like [Acanthaster planci]